MSLQSLLFVVTVNAALWGAAALPAGRLLPGAPRVARLLATALIGWVALIMLLQVLSVMQRMTAGNAVVSIAGVCIVPVALSLRRLAIFMPVKPMPRMRFQFPLVAATGVALAAGLYHLLHGLLLPVEPISDAPIYHLYFAVQWWQAGAVKMVATPFGELAATHFPANGDLWFSWLIMLTESELLAKVGQWPFWLLAGIAVYALARQIGATRASAVFPAALWMTGSAVLLQGAGIANVDLIFTTWFLVAVYFLVHYVRSAASEAFPLFLFALATGAALGTHATSLFFSPLILVPACFFVCTGPQRYRHSVLLAVGLLLPCIFWYGRNWWITGNPVYPVQVELLGIPLLHGWYDRATMLESTYHIPCDRLGQLAVRLAAVIDVRPIVLPVARSQLSTIGVLALAFAHLALWPLALLAAVPRRSGRRHDARSRSLLPAAIALLALAYVADFWWIVPYQTQQRFLYPAAALAVVPLARLLDARPWFQYATLFVLAGHVVLHVLNAPQPHPWQSRTERFYPDWDYSLNLLPAWHTLERNSTPGGIRVAYAGTNLPYYCFGRKLRNQVSYVNVNAPQEFLLHDYHLQRRAAGRAALANDPWPQWYREQPDYETWLANLRRLEIDVLLVARENRHGRPGAPAVPPFPIEYDFATQHPQHFEALPAENAPGLQEPWARVFRLKKAGQ